MANYLLDMHVFLWWMSDADKLSREVYEIIADASNLIYISSATVWEIAIKEALGKLRVHTDLDRAIALNGCSELKISALCAATTKTLPLIHRDPFDRMLIAQAIREESILITADRLIARYPDVSVLHFKPRV